VENRHGDRAHTVHGAPAATVLHAAHEDLQRQVTSSEADRFSRLVAAQYADVARGGLWFTPLREALDAYVVKMQERVTGAVRLKLFKGACEVVGRSWGEPGLSSAASVAGTPRRVDHNAPPAVPLVSLVPQEAVLRKA
jgi:argininosuccinate synthase